MSQRARSKITILQVGEGRTHDTYILDKIALPTELLGQWRTAEIPVEIGEVQY